jgi:alpha-1,6-mannosyltransferase
MLVAFVLLALWARRREAGALTGLALAAATLTKFYPAVLAPALWRRRDWVMPVVFAAAVILAYLPFIGVGWRVFGFLPGYLSEEGFAGGGGFYLLGLVRLAAPAIPTSLYLAAAAVVLGALGLAILLAKPRPGSDIAGAAALATAFIVLLSPHYPWYFAWLIPFACLLPCRSLLWLTAASMLLYLVPVGSHLVRDGHRLLVETVIYAPFAALALIDWRQRQQVRHGKPKRG